MAYLDFLSIIELLPIVDMRLNSRYSGRSFMFLGANSLFLSIAYQIEYESILVGFMGRS